MMCLSSVPCGPSVVACLVLYLLRRPKAVPALTKPAAPALEAVPELKPAAPAQQPKSRPSKGSTGQQAASKPKKKWGGGTKSKRERAAVFDGLQPAVLDRIHTEQFLRLKTEARLTYDTSVHQFRELIGPKIASQLSGVDPCSFELNKLHHAIPDFEPTKGYKQLKKAMLAPFSAAGDARVELQAVFEGLVCDVIAPYFDQVMGAVEIVYYGKLCVRIQPPSDKAMGYPHTDSQYQHQPGQVAALTSGG